MHGSLGRLVASSNVLWGLGGLAAVPLPSVALHVKDLKPWQAGIIMVCPTHPRHRDWVLCGLQYTPCRERLSILCGTSRQLAEPY